MSSSNWCFGWGKTYFCAGISTNKFLHIIYHFQFANGVMKEKKILSNRLPRSTNLFRFRQHSLFGEHSLIAKGRCWIIPWSIHWIKIGFFFFLLENKIYIKGGRKTGNLLCQLINNALNVYVFCKDFWNF